MTAYVDCVQLLPPLTTGRMHELVHAERTQFSLVEQGPDFYHRLREYRRMTSLLLSEAESLQDGNAISSARRGLQLSEDLVRTRTCKLLAILSVDSEEDLRLISGMQPEERTWLLTVVDEMDELREKVFSGEEEGEEE